MIIKQQEGFVEENMSNLTCAPSREASVSSTTIDHQNSNSFFIPHHQQQQHYFPQQSQSQSQDQDQGQDQEPQLPPAKRKRNLPGNPDPEAEVIALSPKSLLATNRFVCEICNKGFQRDQNLQLHRRGHNLPWKLKQRNNKEVVRKKVYVCPEPSCVHHDPSRALGDLTGIKKHFCRKHGEKKWKCEKCSKRYAVQSDWKAHSKVCGTREYRCDCGTLFSRRDSFITHRAFCDALAEETARSITTNSLLSNPISTVAGSSSSQFIINLQQQQQQQLFLNNQQQQDPLHSFPLKREQQQPNLIINNLPPWLSSSSSSSSMMFHQDHHHHHHHQVGNPNNNNNTNTIVGPTNNNYNHVPYHTQTLSPPHMSATALLQKAAQMGATTTMSSSTDHVTDTTTTTTTTTTTSAAGLFGLNMSGPGPGPGPGPNSFLHDMMINSALNTSSYDHHHHGNDGMTRDFLGLRPLSQNEILTILATNSAGSHGHDHGHGHGHHHHQHDTMHHHP